MTITESGKVPTTSPTVRTPRIKVLWASLVGTSLESYDFYVFSYLSAFFLGPLFFEPLGVFGGFLAAFLTNALGFVARPLGAIVFGQLGDRIGRRKTLIVTITMMGVATGLIGVLPDYATAGYLGAVLLVSLRLLQGLSLAGEWGGAVLLASEHGGPKRHGFYARSRSSARRSVRSSPRRSTSRCRCCCRPRRSAGVGLAHPVPRRVPAARGLALAAVRGDRDARLRARARRGAPRAHPAADGVPQASRRPAARDRRRAARDRLVLADEHLHARVRLRATRLRLQPVAARDDDRCSAAAGHHPAVRGVGESHRVVRGSC